MGNRLNKFCEKNHNYGLYTFLLAIAMACVLFVPFIIINGGIFYYYGDFNVQEIPFYQLVHDSVLNGQTGWHHLTDLGSDLISSYSFYLLGSPFFWLTMPFPSEAVPYLIGPLLILKFGCAGLSAYLYLKRYTKARSTAMIGGLMYAFSGFSIYNVFFFHFHEPLIIFPLLLAALDAFVYDKKRVVFAIAVFSACTVNYYFFVGQALFVAMYYLMLVFTKTCKFSIKEFLLLALEVALGFMATAFILLPSVLGLMGNPRLDGMPHGWQSLVYNAPQKYWLILISFFFPSDTPAFPVFTPESNCKWASVAGWIPLISMTGVFAYMQLKCRTWLKKLITLLIVFAFVPVLNSMFQMMNCSIYYARWFYMLVLMLVLASVKALENEEADWNRAIKWTTGITVGISVLVGLMPNITEEKDKTEKVSIGVQASFERFWIYVLLALMSLLAFVLIYKKFKTNARRFKAMMLVGTVAVSMFTSAFVISSGFVSSNTSGIIKNDIINRRNGIKIEDIDEVRSDFFECVDNTQMFWQIQSINCFQSSVSTSIMKFYKAMGITRDVASRPPSSAYGLRSFLSCKYMFDYRADGRTGSDKSFIDKEGCTKMPLWNYKETDNGFDIYENQCYIPMGFTFDSFVTEEEFERVDKSHRTEALLYSLILNRKLMEKYSDITGYTDEKYEDLYGENPEKFDSVVEKYKFGAKAYEQACINLKASSCSSFEYTYNGFTANFNNQGDKNLLFFSVPYSEGFSATVNGKAVDVEQVDYGFMAVEVPANTECTIVFTYETPGLATGCAISLVALCLIIGYATITIIYRATKKRKTKDAEFMEAK